MDYQSLNLTANLLPINSPINNMGGVSPYEYDSSIGRGYISQSKLGTFSANFIFGGTLVLGGVDNGNGLYQIKDAAGSVIIEGNNTGHHYYGTTGLEQIRIDSAGFTAYSIDGTTPTFAITKDGFFSYGTSENLIQLRETPSSTASYGKIGFSSTYGFILQSADNKGLYLWGNNTQMIASGTQTIAGFSGAGTAVQIFSDSDMLITATSSGHKMFLAANSDVNVDTLGKFDVDAGGNIDFTCDNFILNGSTKSAIVPTSKGYKALYCMESPEVWFMDFCKGKRKWWKFWTQDYDIKMDPMFAEVTEGETIIMSTLTKGMVQVWRRRATKGNIRFESKTQEEFHRNNRFWSQSFLNNN